MVGGEGGGNVEKMIDHFFHGVLLFSIKHKTIRLSISLIVSLLSYLPSLPLYLSISLLLSLSLSFSLSLNIPLSPSLSVYSLSIYLSISPSQIFSLFNSLFCFKSVISSTTNFRIHLLLYIHMVYNLIEPKILMIAFTHFTSKATRFFDEK